MNWFRAGIDLKLPVVALLAILLLPGLLCAEEFETFQSEEFGFSMKYPVSWKKIDTPKGNYYKVFQAPEITENFRNRIHVAAHKPVKDSLQVFLQELRNGIMDLQKKAGAGEKQQVRIIDEGEFRCEVPGAYYFFIQAYENKLKLWMDIVIVFYKYQDTLVRISCLAPSSIMDRFHELFNNVLVSVRFDVPPAGPPAATTPRPGTQAPAPPVSAQPPGMPPATPSMVQPPSGQAPSGPPPAPAPAVRRPQALTPEVTPGAPAVTPGAQPPEPDPSKSIVPRPGPRGPLRQPERPATGIVN